MTRSAPDKSPTREDAGATGAFIAVVGPSGSGKDSIINYARDHLLGRPNFVFPRRIITRQADARSEDHDTLTIEAFIQTKARGGFALDWEAHGLSYALPASIDDDIAAGRVVIVNTSRSLVPALAARYRHLVVVSVSAHPDIIAQRLASRGREDAATIAKRLSRMQVEESLRSDAILIENSGPIEMAGQRFVHVLEDAALDIEDGKARLGED
ncbi:hypothetical protein XM25_20510 [Devosia sp. H5989]|nr:hypothetical protein XM25_20510 [Devosia sp. H5989]